MSSKDKNSIYSVGIIIFAIILLVWMKEIIILTTLPIYILEFSPHILSLKISLLSIGLFLWLLKLVYTTNKTVRIPEENYLSLYFHAQIGLLTTSLDGSQIIMANPKMLEILGFRDFSELQNLSAYSLWSNPSDRLEFIKQLQIHSKLSGYRAKAVCKDGSIKDLEIYAIHNSHSGLIKANINDITELIKNREQAEAANLAKSQFLANISHEIRTPMIGILGAVDLLEQSSAAPQQLSNIRIIRECGEQLLRIINEILDVSKIEVDLITLNPENCNIYDLFYQTIQIVEPILKEKGLTFELDLHSISSVEAYLDPYKVRQILTNILFNAIKFTAKGTIKLKSHINYGASQNQLIISITDTGIGIPREHIPLIFDPFSQIDNSTSRGFEGTGLGLYICQKLVEMMQGNIEVISELGNGSEFIITLPLSISSGSYTNQKDTSKPHNINDTIPFIPRSVLVVEDNELNQNIVNEMLRNYGFEVTNAINGLECLQILQHRSFDIILLDMQMPLMDGYETARLIRSDRSINHIPIIAMTAHAMNGDREKCIASGCTSYIAKPFKSEDLVNEIKQHFNSNCSNIRNLNHYNNLFINDLIPTFISTLEDTIKDLQQAISNNDIPKIKSICHDIKGTSGLYGFNMISNTAAQIEQAAQENSMHKLQNLNKHLCQLFEEANKEIS